MVSLKIRDVMIKKVITIGPGATVQEAARSMEKSHVGCLVVTVAKQPIGMVTESDIIRKTVSTNKNPAVLKVENIMTKPIVSGEPDDDLTETTVKMIKSRIRRLPVIKDGRLVGILTDTDIVRMSPNLIALLNERLKTRSYEEGVHTKEASGICERCGNYSDGLVERGDEWMCEDCREEA